MWKDNPLIGVGSGNYQNTLIVSYLWTIPHWAETTLSHTSFISILAELGLVGLGVFVLFAFRLFLTCVRSYHATTDHYTRLLVGWLGAAFVEILFQSQSEGRLLEEPFLYLLIAILISLELGAGMRGNDPVIEALREPVAEPRPEPARARQPEPRPQPQRTPARPGQPLGHPGGG